MKNCGFDTADINLGGDMQLIKEDAGQDHLTAAMKLRDFCDRLGIAVNQTHAPFFEGVPMPEGFGEQLLQCVEATALLGADQLVVHGDTWYSPNYLQWDREEVVDTVYEVYAPVVELADKKGVRIAMETLFEHKGSLYHRVRFCSLTEELDEIIGRFRCDTVGACWDFGHSNVAYGEDQFKAMKKLKSRIIATHVHDNNRRFDNHDLPYQGTVNWAEGLRTLAEVGYTGDLTLEMGSSRGVPDSLIEDYLRYAHKTAAHMRAQFLEAQKAHEA